MKTFLTECQKPPVVEKGTHPGFEVYLSPMSLEYSCEPGYRFFGNNKTTCNENGEWDGELGGCYTGENFYKRLF